MESTEIIQLFAVGVAAAGVVLACTALIIRGIYKHFDVLIADVKKVSTRLDDTRIEIGKRFDTTNARIDLTRIEVGTKLEATNSRMDDIRIEVVKTIDDTRVDLSESIEATNSRIDKIRKELIKRIDDTNNRVDATNNERIDDTRKEAD